VSRVSRGRAAVRVATQVRHRIRSEWANVRRAVGLVGWRRVTGPQVRRGVLVGGPTANKDRHVER